MYDSDEVRDAVRREMLQMLPGMDRSLTERLSPWERAAINDAVDAKAAEYDAWRERLVAAMQNFLNAVIEEVERVARAFIEGLAPVVQQAIAAIEELADQLGLLHEDAGAPPFSWRGRRRKPECRPVRPVDAVAAGRHPAMLFRSRRVGGRR